MKSFLTRAMRDDLKHLQESLTLLDQNAWIKTLLDRIEITADSEQAKRLESCRLINTAAADAFKGHDVHITNGEYLTSLRSCSQSFGVWLVDDQITIHPMRCRLRPCPTCQGIRNDAWYHRLTLVTKAMSAPKHIVLTLKHTTEPLDVQIDHLKDSFRRLRQQHIWSSRSPWGYSVMEIKYNKDTGLYHPHLHIIANMAWLSVKALANAWEHATGTSFIVHIRAIHSNIAAYTTKYIAKAAQIFTNVPDPWLALQQLKGRRFVSSFGKLPPYDKPEPSVSHFIGTMDWILKKAHSGNPYYQFIASQAFHTLPKSIIQSVSHAPPSAGPHRPPCRATCKISFAPVPYNYPSAGDLS